MTPEQMDRIDALVQKHVMQREPVPLEPGTYSFVQTWSPTRDGNAMLEVIEKMRLDGRKVTFETCYAGGKIHNDVIVSANINDLKAFGEAEADTMPLAVCLAALKALGVEVPNV